MNTKVKRKSVLNYFGGKSRQLDWILPLFPKHKGYLESFCGSASVFLNKEPSEIEVINDYDSRLYNFFEVLRNHPQELIRLLELTMYSRTEFQMALERHPDPIEDARRYFVRSQQSFAGQSHGTRRKNSWRLSISESRRGMAQDVSRWLSKIEGLADAVGRLKVAAIENRSFDVVKQKFDHRDWFHFDDPPYVHETRSGKSDYEHEFSLEQHEHLADINNKTRALVMVCGYDNPHYRKWYKSWKMILGPDKVTNLGKTRDSTKREVVWINYNPPGSSYNLFH